MCLTQKPLLAFKTYRLSVILSATPPMESLSPNIKPRLGAPVKEEEKSFNPNLQVGLDSLVEYNATMLSSSLSTKAWKKQPAASSILKVVFVNVVKSISVLVTCVLTTVCVPATSKLPLM